MLKSIIILPDGTEISSGVGQTNNIRNTVLTECVNSGEELTLGSVCASMLEATIQNPSGNLSMAAGAEITLCKEDADGRHQVGVFKLEKPTRPSANLLKIVGYDRVAKLDKDLTSWLKSLTAWPYPLLTFAGMVCQACGLTLITESVPNGDYPVQQIEVEATGRQLMGWIGEVCCRFCRATSSGDIELAWYRQSAVSIAPSGEHFYFQRGLSFEDYRVAPVDAVQIRLADSDDGMLWPAAADGANCYVIKNNPIFMAAVTENTHAALGFIEGELAGASYTPCKVSIPATLDIHAGDIVQITDINGVALSAYVMTKTQKGQRDTLECTGSPRRDSSMAVNNQSSVEATDRAVKNAFAGLTQQQIFDKLTSNGLIQGLFMKDGQIYINVSYLATGVITSADGTVKIDLMNNCVEIDTVSGNGHPGKLQLSSNGLKGFGWDTEAEDYVQTLQITPGDNMGDSATTTNFTSVYGDGGVSIAPGKSGAAALFGTPQSDTRIRGKTVEIGGKPCTWEDNGDNTFTLIGNMENQRLPSGDMDIKMVRSGQTVTVTTTLQDGSIVVDTIELDENDCPVSGTFDGVDCTITMEGI